MYKVDNYNKGQKTKTKTYIQTSAMAVEKRKLLQTAGGDYSSNSDILKEVLQSDSDSSMFVCSSVADAVGSWL